MKEKYDTSGHFDTLLYRGHKKDTSILSLLLLSKSKITKITVCVVN